MEKISARRKSLRRNYKRLAAAVIGTAMLTGAALPGLPLLSKASASERTSYPVTAKQLKRDGWHEHNHSWPSSDENQGWYENGRIYYRSDSNRHYDRSYSYSLSSPIELVKDYAGKYGFDRYRDAFTMLSQSNHSASVLVIKNTSGQRFKVDLERNSGDWQIVAIRAI